MTLTSKLTENRLDLTVEQQKCLKRDNTCEVEPFFHTWTSPPRKHDSYGEIPLPRHVPVGHLNVLHLGRRSLVLILKKITMLQCDSLFFPETNQLSVIYHDLYDFDADELHFDGPYFRLAIRHSYAPGERRVEGAMHVV